MIDVFVLAMDYRGISKKFGGILRLLVSRNVLLFIVFLLISFVFWSLLALNEEVQKEVSVPIRLTDLPDSVTVLSDVPKAISANIKTKDSHFLKYTLKEKPPVGISFERYRKGDRILLGESEIREIMRGVFGGSSQILSINPDSIGIFFTALPGKPVKLLVHVEASTESQYTISGEITSELSTVMVYSLSELPASLTQVETVPVVCNSLNKTTVVKARVIAPLGTRVIPDSVEVTIPVEPLIVKRRNIQITVLNEPQDRRLITFPSQIEVSYLLPMSLYNSDDCPIMACVDYADVDTAGGVSKLPVALAGIPSSYKGVESALDSVEYIIEQK